MSDEFESSIPSAARDLETVPDGLERPMPPPDGVIDGAPPWAQLLFRELHESRKDMRRVLTNQQLSSREFATFRAETRGRFSSHEAELEIGRTRMDTLDEVQLAHSVRLDGLERRVKDLEDGCE